MTQSGDLSESSGSKRKDRSLEMQETRPLKTGDYDRLEGRKGTSQMVGDRERIVKQKQATVGSKTVRQGCSHDADGKNQHS